jgi:hypothetical protein
MKASRPSSQCVAATPSPPIMLDHTRQLLSHPDAADPRELLADVLRSVRELLSSPDNDFAWSSWTDRNAAVAEVESMLALLDGGELPDRLQVSVLFAVTGPLQEVSLSSGWADTFLKVAERFDRAERLLWP